MKLKRAPIAAKYADVESLYAEVGGPVQLGRGWLAGGG